MKIIFTFFYFCNRIIFPRNFIIFISNFKNDYKKLTEFIKKTYNLKILDVIVREEMNFSKNLPCELILKIEN